MFICCNRNRKMCVFAELRKLGSKVQKYSGETSWKGIVDQIQQYLKCETGQTEGPEINRLKNNIPQEK